MTIAATLTKVTHIRLLRIPTFSDIQNLPLNLGNLGCILKRELQSNRNKSPPCRGLCAVLHAAFIQTVRDERNVDPKALGLGQATLPEVLDRLAAAYGL